MSETTQPAPQLGAATGEPREQIIAGSDGIATFTGDHPAEAAQVATEGGAPATTAAPQAGAAATGPVAAVDPSLAPADPLKSASEALQPDRGSDFADAFRNRLRIARDQVLAAGRTGHMDQLAAAVAAALEVLITA
jgi:hypothetical protein